MKVLIRWIIFAILFILMIILLVNVANKAKTKPKTSTPPTVYEKSTTNNSDEEDNLEPISDVITTNQSIEVGNTASSATLYVCVGMFVLSIGAYYIYKKQLN